MNHAGAVSLIAVVKFAQMRKFVADAREAAITAVGEGGLNPVRLARIRRRPFHVGYERWLKRKSATTEPAKQVTVKGRFVHHTVERGFVYEYDCPECGRKHRSTSPEQTAPTLCHQCFHGDQRDKDHKRI